MLVFFLYPFLTVLLGWRINRHSLKRQTGRQTNRQTDRQAGRQSRQADRHNILVFCTINTFFSEGCDSKFSSHHLEIKPVIKLRFMTSSPFVV